MQSNCPKPPKPTTPTLCPNPKIESHFKKNWCGFGSQHVLEFYLVFNTLGIKTEPNYRKCENQRANFGLILERRPFHLVSIPHDFGFRGQFQVSPRYLNLELLGHIQQFKYPPNIGHDIVLF
jgi:hypothetical protein